MTRRRRPVRALSVLLCRVESAALAHRVAASTAFGAGRRRAGAPPPPSPRRDAGQATVEYALVVLAAAGLALLAIAWAARTGRIGDLFDRVFDRVIAGAG